MALLDHPTIGSPVDRSAAARPLLAEPGRPHVPVAVGPGWLPHPAAFRIGPEPSMKYPLQHTKVQRPPLREQTLHRERLLEWLASHIDRQIVLVVAKAGYGKTTLLSDFSRRTRVRTLWYRLDEDDRDWVSFLHYLVAAGREADPTFAPETARLLDDVEGGATRQEMLETFYREMRSLADVPTALIFDDYHLAHDVPDIRAIVHDLVLRAPDGLTLVFLTRRMPTLPMARLRTLGQVAELDGDDLLFDRAETEQLFRETYRRPLEPDVLADLHDRTEGWAASLEMVHAALRNRAPTDIRRFVHELSGEQDELYDYLAEEVVGSLDDELQRFLMATSLLQVVEAETAAIAADTSPSRTAALIEGAERAGLLARRSEGTRRSHRYHPLVRSFLNLRLEREIGRDAVAERHTAIAIFAEGKARDWRLAAYHFAAAGRTSDHRRVVAQATPTIMATGEVALAHSYVDRFLSSEPNPWFDLLAARILLRLGNIDEALGRATIALERFGGVDGDGERAGVDLALASQLGIALTSGNLAQAEKLAAALKSRQPDADLLAICDATLSVIASAGDGDLVEARASLLAAAHRQKELGQDHYYGITMHNLACIDRARGDANEALSEATQAIQALARSSNGPEVNSARSARAWALAHLNRWDEAEREIDRALNDASSSTRSEVLIEAGDTYGMYGDGAQSSLFISESNPPVTDPSYQQWLLASAHDALRRNDFEAALARIDEHGTAIRPWEPAARTRALVLRAHLAIACRDPQGQETLNAAMAAAQRQQSRLWISYAQVLAACERIGRGDGAPSSGLLAVEPVYLSIAAECITGVLGLLDEATLQALDAEVRMRPMRWLQPIRSAIRLPDAKARLVAARWLEAIGTKEDIPTLRLLSRQQKGRHKDPLLGRRLARRLATPVFVEDQGVVTIRIGKITVAGSSVRRKVLSLLCLLLTRPALAATRDQVLEALWPELPPQDAVNSLNQTVYFLRRVLEPEFDEDTSPGYVHHDGDLVSLDGELVSSRSVDCRNLMKTMGRTPSPDQISELSIAYRGRFALDFAYDEWATAYRESSHARYLSLIERSIGEDTRAGHFDRAIENAQRALEADESADNIELALLRLYRRTGAHAAAAEQYAHYASVLRNDLGVEPPPLESL